MRPVRTKKSLIVFRHGETNWNKKGIIQGRSNIPLNQTGIQQSYELAHNLKAKNYPLDVIITSPLSRAKQTAEIVQQIFNVPLYYDERLVECNCGIFEGQPKDVEFFSKWENPKYPYLRPENGESNINIFNRAISGLEDFIKKNPDFNCIGVSTHRGVIRRLINFLRDKPSDEHIPNTFYFQMFYDTKEKRFELIN